jgi:hypothetical protein
MFHADRTADLFGSQILKIMEIRKTPVTRENPYYEWTLQESVDYLRWVLREFPFGDWKVVTHSEADGGTGEPIRQSRSQAVQVAGMLSLFCMGLIPKGSNRMGFIYNANSQRSGKTLLAKLAIMTITGAFKAQPWKGNEDELNKLLDSEMLAGSMYVCFDNVRGYMSSQTLEGLMTSPQWTGRVLGRTQMFTAENRMNLFITGNDCIVSPDMSHRCLICDLFVEQGDVQERQVENLIDEPWLMDKENRRNTLSALWGIVRAWGNAGEPNASSFGFKPRLGFERWGEIIGGIVGFAGFGNPLEKVQLEQAGDSEERNIRKLIDRMRDMALGDNRGEFSFQQIVDFCHDDGLFDYMLDGRETQDGYKLNASSSSRFSLTLGRYAPKVSGGYIGNGGDRSRPPRKYRRKIEAGEEMVYLGCFGDGRGRKYFIEWVV